MSDLMTFGVVSYNIVPAHIVDKTALDIMMKDVNDCEKYLFLVSDENWLRFCKFFNECVQTYGSVDEELHYFRLKLNRTPKTLEDMLEIIENDSSSWILCSERKARYHMYGSDGEYNVKFVSSTQKTNNMYEAIYNLKDFNIISTTNEVIANKCKLWNCQEMCSRRISKILDRQESGGMMSRLG